MPTHVVIRATPRPSAATLPSSSVPLPQQQQGHRHQKNGDHTPEENSKVRRTTAKTKTPICGVVGFRSSVRRTTKKKQHQRSRRRMVLAKSHSMQDNLHLSRDDIRASPRLQGYLYMLVASIVMLVSSVRFYLDRDDVETIQVVRQIEEEDGSAFTNTFGARVLTWKLYGAVAVSAGGVGLSLFILLVHFDSVCFPNLWKFVFRDASPTELTLLVALMLFWIAGLHICTSSFSVGEVAPNVYFTTWIAFASVAVNIGVWRNGADLPSLVELIKSHPRETVFGWFTILLFGLVTSLSVAELYANRDELEFLISGETKQQVPQREWNKALGSSFAVVAVALLNLVGCHYNPTEKLSCCGGRCSFSFDWEKVEGFFALSVLGLFSWFIYEYTGVNSALSGPSNPYFGSWGIWFCSIFTFGTWLRENKPIDFILRKGEESDATSIQADGV